jgi:hypothetical protein
MSNNDSLPDLIDMSDLLPPESRQRFVHDIKAPLVAVRHGIDAAVATAKTCCPELVPHLEYAITALQITFDRILLMNSASENANKERISLVDDVFGPAFHRARESFRHRRLPADPILYEGPICELALVADQSALMELVTILFRRAILDASDDASFRMEIECRMLPERLAIHFRDWGDNIAGLTCLRQTSRIVLSGRELDHRELSQGIALLLALKIAQAQGGCLQLSRDADPTEFTLFLPSSDSHA